MRGPEGTAAVAGAGAVAGAVAAGAVAGAVAVAVAGEDAAGAGADAAVRSEQPMDAAAHAATRSADVRFDRGMSERGERTFITSRTPRFRLNLTPAPRCPYPPRRFLTAEE